MNENIERWKAEILHNREAIRRLRLHPPIDPVGKLKNHFAINERRALIRDRKRAIEAAKDAYQPKTGAKCSCKRGVQRDNCPACEGTGFCIDFAAIRARAKS